MARVIDGDAVKRRTWDIAEAWKDQGRNYEALLLESVIEQIVDTQPALTPPNEPLTLISMSDEIPPDNERVLVYRPCMVDSDTGPYSVQWGWAAKRDGSHWARLPDRRPPEGEV